MLLEGYPDKDFLNFTSLNGLNQVMLLL